jgi:hypothetical protein
MTMKETLHALEEVKQAIELAYSSGYSAGKQQSKWQGLTDTEIDYQAKKDDHGVYFALGALWAEAKLKERNHD